MNTIPDVRGAHPGGEQRQPSVADRHPAPSAGPVSTAPPGAQRRQRWAAAATRVRYPLTVYVLSRALYLVIAVLDTFVRHWSLGRELSNWDGKWYLLTAQFGFPHHLPPLVSGPTGVHMAYSTLGFLPLYPMLMWALGAVWPGTGYLVPGVLVSLATGAVATVLIYRLACRWWGDARGRRAILFFCLFPGSIVFSMVYSEGVLLVLVAGALLALEHRRWLLAGLLAGLSTAVSPVALAIVPACAAVALLHLRRGRSGGSRPDSGRPASGRLRALVAPLLSPLGLIGFGVFLWFWTGSPLSSYRAQHDAWRETSTPLAVLRDAWYFLEELLHFGKFASTPPDMNLVSGVLGAVFLLWGLVHLWRSRAAVSLGALVWTAGVAVLALTSNSTPPNPRMLLCAFPAVLVIGADCEGAARKRLLLITLLVTVAMSIDTFVGSGLRP